MEKITRLGRWLSRPILLHWLLPYLMALVLVGTVAQKYIGLYDSQRQFFSSFILWIGAVPLPGVRMVTALLLISLLAKLLLDSPWQRAKAGIFVAHLGVMLLLLGGLLTACLSVEGYIALAPDESSTVFFDYHARELTVSKNAQPIMRIPLADIVTNKLIASPSLPFTLTVNALCRNCTMATRNNASGVLHGVAQKVMLSPLANDLEEERNFAGVEFSVSGAGKNSDGVYIAFEPMEKQPIITVGADQYTIALGRLSYALPFTLTLLRAEKENYPGTDMVSSYRSIVMVSDGALQQKAVITMNHPLRYNGYTVYQSSFNGEDATRSVSFAVVKNSGRVFPYVASVTLCIGLLMHLCLRLPALIRRRKHAV